VLEAVVGTSVGLVGSLPVALILDIRTVITRYENNFAIVGLSWNITFSSTKDSQIVLSNTGHCVFGNYLILW